MGDAMDAEVLRHMVDDSCTEPDDTGFYVARCYCGFEFGPLPGITEVIDVLMEHAAVVAGGADD